MRMRLLEKGIDFALRDLGLVDVERLIGDEFVSRGD